MAVFRSLCTFNFILVCHQLSRGVLAIFGPTHLFSLEMLTSVTNFYQVPYISWSYLDRFRAPRLKRQEAYKILKKRHLKRQSHLTQNRPSEGDDEGDEYEYEQGDYYENPEIITQANQYPDSRSGDDIYQLYLRPDLTPALISIVNFYEWPRVYYIYNYQQGK
jgi:hypothetical protein